MVSFVSAGQLLGEAEPWSWWSHPWGGVRAEDRVLDYATIYQLQPHVRTYVDLIARNIAQLGIHAYRRVSADDRVRLVDHPLVDFLEKPNGWTTRHRWIYALLCDKLVFGDSFWVKAKDNPFAPLALIRVPPQWVDVEGGLAPSGYRLHLHTAGSGEAIDVDPDMMVHFRCYNPHNCVRGLSPIESLRGILEEDFAAVAHRRDTWNNAGRQPMVLRRPATAPRWGPEVAARFNEAFTAAMRSPRAATTPMLEDDMDLQLLSFNAEQSQYVESRQLTREEVATAYHIPLSMAGIAGASATFASVREFRTMLYVDTLGPWIDELETELMLQLVPDFPDTEDVYVEMNVHGLLSGDFGEQITWLEKSIGRPFLTPNEGRSRLNLPRKGGLADELAVPTDVDPSGRGAALEVETPMTPTTNGHAPIPGVG